MNSTQLNSTQWLSHWGNPTLLSLYSNVYYCVKLNGVISDQFSSNVGVKQGCGLSPLLFSIFINKLPEIYDQSCDPVRLGSLDLNSLLWADDLVILSTSETYTNYAVKQQELRLISIVVTINYQTHLNCRGSNYSQLVPNLLHSEN